MEVAPGPRVEAGRRLVQEQQLGPADEPDGGVEAAALAPGQRGQPLLGLLGQPDRLQQLVHVLGPPPPGGRVRGVVAAEVGQELAHLPAPVVTPGLEHHPDLGPPPLVAPAGSTPSTLTSPAERIRKPSRISMVVVLPAPFGPSRAITSPRPTWKSTPWSTSRDP